VTLKINQSHSISMKTKASRILPVFCMALLAPAALLILAGCGKKEEPPAPEVIRPVKMISLQAGGLVREVALPGQVFPAIQANMSFEVSGVMTKIHVVEGQEVKAGKVLAELDPRDYQAAFDAAEAQLDIARTEAERARALYESQATSKQRLDSAESQLKVAQATFDKAEKALEDTSLVAQIDGVVALILVDDIVNIQAKQDILILQDNTSLKVTVDIPETLSILADRDSTNEERTERAKVRVSMTALPNRSFDAQITEISMTADPLTRTYKGTVSMKRPDDLNILPGMTATVTATLPRSSTGSADVFHIPAEAVFSDDQGNAAVWVVSPDDMSVRQQVVTKGTIVGDNMEVFSDELSDGDLVVVSGISQLAPGQKVRQFEK
jgi:RND family efflux transporter MFP subunit